jgi:hypothetical protein
VPSWCPDLVAVVLAPLAVPAEWPTHPRQPPIIDAFAELSARRGLVSEAPFTPQRRR